MLAAGGLAFSDEARSQSPSVTVGPQVQITGASPFGGCAADDKVILYADRETGSMQRAMAETARRRARQEDYNRAHGITPQSIKKNIADIMGSVAERDHVLVDAGMGGMAEEGREFIGHNMRAHIEGLEKKMRDSAANLEFEDAARIRDEIKRLQAVELTIADGPFARQSEVDEAADAAVKGRDDKTRHGVARQHGAGSTKGRAGTRTTRYKK